MEFTEIAKGDNAPYNHSPTVALSISRLGSPKVDAWQTPAVGSNALAKVPSRSPTLLSVIGF